MNLTTMVVPIDDAETESYRAEIQSFRNDPKNDRSSAGAL